MWRAPVFRPSCSLHPARITALPAPQPTAYSTMQELDPYKSSEAAHDFNAPPAPPINPDEVTRLADFKNAPLLAAFLSGEA